MPSDAREPLQRPRPRTAARSASVVDELGRHEAMLSVGRPGWSLACSAGRALSYGIGVREDAVYLRRARDRSIPLARRGSGGTGVVHFERDLAWAVVLPRSDPRVGTDFVHAYDRLGRPIAEGLGRVGLAATWKEAPGLVPEYCPLSARGKVLVVRDLIIAGAGQHATSRAVLHHGFLSWSVDREEVDRLFDLPTGGPSRRLGGIAELAPGLDPETLARALADALAAFAGP